MNMLGNTNNNNDHLLPNQNHNHNHHHHQHHEQNVENNGNGNGNGDGLQLKKGPWTAAEDTILAEYVRKHGEGNWNAVQRNTGLARCGKSCRLRWANHLRPNLKKGAFSPEEERLIVELHSQLGNKWARMAAQLPGRTDNEIKNYWNTRVKRRLRQGLPLYPPELQQQQQSRQSPVSTPTTPTSSFTFHASPSPAATATTPPPAQHHYLQQFPRSPTPNCLSPTPPQPLSPSLHSPHNHLPTLSLFDNNSKANGYNHFNVHRAPPLLQNPLRFKRFHADPSLSSATTTSSPVININGYNDQTHNSFNPYQNTSFSLPYSTFLRSHSHHSHQHVPHSSSYPNLVSLHNNGYATTPFESNPSSSFLRTQFDGSNSTNLYNNCSVFDIKHELPSNQLFSHGNSAAAELGFDGFDSNSDQKLSLSRGGSGLLEDLLDETNTVNSVDDDQKREQFSGFNHWSDHSNSLSQQEGTKVKEETGGDQMSNSTMQEDLSKIFNVINPSMQVPTEWYNNNDTGEGSNGPSSVVTDDNISLEMQQIASMLRVDSTGGHVKTPGSCSIDNLPGIC